MVDVEYVVIPWDPDSEDISILTNSVKGSDDNVVMWFYDDSDKAAGGVNIKFSSPIKYYIPQCSPSYTPFPVPTTYSDRQDLGDVIQPGWT